MSVDPARLTAWQALSGLFLDTELNDGDIAALARELRSTGFSVTELESMYEEEVAPVCWRNLHALPGGVWTGFQPKWLADAITGRRAGALERLPWIKRLQVKRWTALSRADWERVKRALAA